MTTVRGVISSRPSVTDDARAALSEIRSIIEANLVQGDHETWHERPDDTLDAIWDALNRAADRAETTEVTGSTSDGYHTFDELYEYRMLYNAHAAYGWHAADIPVVKSWRHSDGQPCFGGGWFVVVATLPTGQVSNHYKAEHWDLFQVPEVDLPPEYDGHTPADAATRLHAALAATRAETREGVGTGAGEGDDPAQTEATSRVTRSLDCPEAPAQAHPRPSVTDDARAAWVEAVRRYPSDVADRGLTYPTGAVREHSQAAFVAGARWATGDRDD